MKRFRLSEQARKSKLEKDKAKVARYRALTDKVLTNKANEVYTLETLEDNTTLLRLNPEFNAVWNYRRHIMLHLFGTEALDRATTLDEDLALSMEMMKQYPKCYWIWNHRRWCLETHPAANWARELAIVLKLLQMDARNFHGWHYRRYIVAQLGPKSPLTKQEKGQLLQVALAEFEFTTAKIRQNTSNFSAWHNRTKLIPQICSLARDLDPADFAGDLSAAAPFVSPAALLDSELELVKTGMFMDADDTSVWLYMQWLLSDSLFAQEDGQRRQLLQTQLESVKELNELEKEDSDTHTDNVWCLKMMVFIESLLARLDHRDPLLSEGSSESEVVKTLRALLVLDPQRKGLYLDQIAAKALLLC